MIELDVIVRCRNEMPHTRSTLQALAAQEGVAARVLFLDCGSTDGSREEAERAGATIHDIAPSEYVPGAVLNLGMRLTRSPLVAFINADAVPLRTDALRELLRPLEEAGTAASYGRQEARSSAGAQTQLDHRRAFGVTPAPLQLQRGTFFSMAASALRRDAWETLLFDERLRYSEDADWTYRASALGYRITYVPAARFEHSHDYPMAGQLRRRRGEGVAETAIFRLGPPSVMREFVRPLLGSLVGDLKVGAVGLRPLTVRAVQSLGRYAGRRESAVAACDERRSDPGPAPRSFTFSAEPAAEQAIGAALEEVCSEVRRVAGHQLTGLSLVGSHARGEGGVCAGANGAVLPHNDLDLVAVVRSSSLRWQRKLHASAERLSARLGFEVGMWTVDEAFLQRVPPTLFWLDIALGAARTVYGQPLQPRLSPRAVPLDEAGRLLANRAVGLALSNLDGVEAPLIRHGHKAVLACGDAYLLAVDRYAPTLRERLVELRQLARAPAIGARLVERYAEALQYRSHPDQWRPAGPLQEWYAGLRSEVAKWHLAFESWRCAAPLDAASFAAQAGRIYQSLPDVRFGATALSAARAAASGAIPLFPWVGHPRERLARVAVAFAYGYDDPKSQEIGRRLLGLGTSASAAEVLSKLRVLAARAG